MLKNLHKILSLLLLTALAACGSSSEEPTPPPVEPEKKAGRTVMVYMVADNSLGSIGCDTDDIDEMQLAVDDGALGPDDRLIVYHNRVGTAYGKAPQLIDIRPGERLTLKTYPDDPDIYSTDEARLREALDDMEALAPAQSYGIVFWSHGTGWIEQEGSRSSASAPEPGMLFSFGEDRKKRMKITTLAHALRDRKFDFIYFDCCHMASVEVAYELRHATDVIVGSGTELPAPGMNYTINLPYFFTRESADMLGAAMATFNYYNDMSGQSRTCTMSVINTTALDDLADASRRVMECAPENPIPISQQQGFMRVNNTLFDMYRYYTNLTGVPDDLMEQWKEAYARTVTYAASTPYVFNILRMDIYSGLGTYIISPSTPADNLGYQNQSWWTDVVSHNPNF